MNEELIMNRLVLVNERDNEMYMLKDLCFVVVTHCHLCSFSSIYIADGCAIMSWRCTCTLLYHKLFGSYLECSYVYWVGDSSIVISFVL